jgi:hypothetical protein
VVMGGVLFRVMCVDHRERSITIRLYRRSIGAPAE